MDVLDIDFDGLKTPKTKPYFTKEYQEQLTSRFHETIYRPEGEFYRLSSQTCCLKSCREIYSRFKECKHFIHIGIGGSSLGPEMLISALKKRTKDTPTFSFVNNIDPDQLEEQLHSIDRHHTLFYIVSKSGQTAETLAALNIVCNKLVEMGIPLQDFKKYCVVATNGRQGALLGYAQKLELSCLEIPSNVGGRYSVLTPVGLFPALFAGIDCFKLLSGAERIKEKLEDIVMLSSFLMSLKDQGMNQTILMPYSSKLRNLGFWFVQLWAESLGKKDNGLTPIPSWGAVDQHGQMQLFMEGPQDKVFILLSIERFTHDFSLEFPPMTEIFGHFKGHKLSELMKAEFFATLRALKQAGRPCAHLKIPEVSESTLGALILFFESLTVLMGYALNVNPFDQPGVELGKKYAQEWPTH